MIGVTSRKPQTQKSEPFNREEEHDLILRARAGEVRALRQLIHVNNRKLIYKAVSRYGFQVEQKILFSAGEAAVHIAARGFNLSKKNKFSTYLYRVILTEVRDCYCDEAGITRNTLRNLGKISKASSTLRQRLGREATLEEIVERSGLSQRQILTAWKRRDAAQPCSLNQGSDESDSEWLDFQIDETANPWHTPEEVEFLDTLDQLKSSGYLEDRQVTILIAKQHGLENTKIGEQLGVSGERVRQLVKKAKQTFFALKEGALKLRPQPAKTTTPVSTHRNIEPIGKGEQLPLDLPVPKKAKKPVMKRVDASRLGGRIGRKIKQIFNQTKVQIAHFDGRRSVDDPITAAITSEAFGGIADATKSILAGSRCSNHRTTNRSGYQSTSTDQRCSGLGQARKAWRGCLGLGQEKFQQPLAGIYQRIRGFSSKLNQWRNNTQLSTVNIFKFFGIGQGSSPPDHKDKFSLETNPFHFGGITMNLAQSSKLQPWSFA